MHPPRPQDIVEHTPQLTLHGHNGYSLGRFTELFVYPSSVALYDDWPAPFYFTMGTTKGSLGQATPLAHFLFDRGHNEDFAGPFSSIISLRLHEVTADAAELAALKAMLLIGRTHGITLSPMTAGDFPWSDEAEESSSS